MNIHELVSRIVILLIVTNSSVFASHIEQCIQKQTWKSWINKACYNRPVLNLLVSPENKALEEVQANNRLRAYTRVLTKKTLSLALNKQKVRNNISRYNLKRKVLVVVGITVLVIAMRVYPSFSSAGYEIVK